MQTFESSVLTLFQYKLMNTVIHQLSFANLFQKSHIKRWAIYVGLLAIPLLGGEETREVFYQSVSDAYLQVSVFVAFTLFVFFSAETYLKIDTESLLRNNKKLQVPFAAFMGMLPGCGGAIITMTQYMMGRLGFGSVIAVLTSTMGDAAFLLIAQEPRAAAIVLSTSFVVGIVFGYFVEWIHGYDFLRPEYKERTPHEHAFAPYRFWKEPWVLLLVLGFIFGLYIAFQKADTADMFFAQFGIQNMLLWTGVIGGILSLTLWFINPTAGTSCSNAFDCKNRNDILEKVTSETVFITTWVVLAYLLYELGVLWTGVDMRSLFSHARPLLPLVGILIGFLPGCGPQVLVTGLYLQGIIPFSAQMGNAISNDGDALFPAIAISRKIAVVATLYTAIPALIVAYGWYFLFEV